MPSTVVVRDYYHFDYYDYYDYYYDDCYYKGFYLEACTYLCIDRCVRSLCKTSVKKVVYKLASKFLRIL